MENKKTYEGAIAEIWKPGKVLKIVVNVSDDEIEELDSKLNKKVKIIIEE